MIFKSLTSKLTRKNAPIQCHPFWLIIASTLFFTFAFNLAYYHKAYEVLKMDSVMDYILFSSFVVVIFCVINSFFCMVLVGKLTKPLLVLLLICSAAGSYFSLFYGIYINSDMITNTMQTNLGEASGLLTFKFIAWVFVLGVLPSLFVVFMVRVKPCRFKASVLWRASSIVISVCLVAMIYMPLSKQYIFFMRNNPQAFKFISPSNYIAGTIKYLREEYKATLPFVNIGMDAERADTLPGQKKKLIVVVVGETSRAQNFSLNGYGRETNPLLKQQTNLINFEQVSSCGTATAVSVPCMFSNMERKKYDGSLAARQDNVLDILARTGINVFWRENDSGCKGVCTRIPNEDLRDIEPKELCPQGLCYDITLLNNLDAYIAQRQDDTVIVLHTNGSHGPTYYQRYQKEQEHFTPACNTNEVDTCSKKELLNVYDNTIVNVDYVLNSTIELLKKHQDQFATAMIYVSDHGESLGENGVYLHASPYAIAPKEQTHVPMIFWLSDTFLQQQQLDEGCLTNTAKNDSYSQDNLFHTLLGGMQVNTQEYKPALDIFNRCKMRSIAKQPAISNGLVYQ